MLTSADVLACDDVLDVFRRLGWPIAPIELPADEWRRAGIALSWNGDSRFTLAARLRRFDLFHLTGTIGEDAIRDFLRSYREYNVLTKSALIYRNGNHAAIYDLSPQKRLRRLDVDLANPTAHTVDRLNLLAFGEEASLPRIFDRALDREAITRQFFQRFRGAVRDVADALAEACPNETREAVDAEALLLLSRLLFLAFVQVKGWLNGERRFLADRLERAIFEQREFFADCLVPLFFGCLNTPASERTFAAKRLGRIPYLNGGLFEPSVFERRNELHLPNELMQRVIEEVFERCDFSIDESDSSAANVDPEMLGKVFESLMAEDERAASGSFYTPREIVDVLTERAIDAWLGDGGLERLERITVLDPACGSGAFLLSALRVIEKKYRALGVDSPGLRQRIVERSLYGVDLKPEAVRLCELRLWLAIVSADDATIETVQPLPNLDRNILQGSSLLSPTDFLGDARADIYRAWVYALHAQRELLDRYRSAPRGERPSIARLIRTNDLSLASDLLARAIDVDEQELQRLTAPQRDLFGRSTTPDVHVCRELQERIAENRQALERVEDGTLDFFSFDIHFAHVIANGGFDVVLGNPPWVRNARIEPRLKRMYRERYSLFRGGDAAFHQPDLSIAFFERAVRLAAPDGVVSMLVPAKLLNAAYAAPLRRFVERELAIVAIDDWSDDPRRFFEADTFPLGLTVRRAEPTQSLTVFGDEWALVPDDAREILRWIAGEHAPLEDVLRRRPIMGVKTGSNDDFFLNAENLTRGNLVTTDGIAIPFNAVCRCVRGRDVRRWTALDSQWMLWPPPSGWRKVPAWLARLAETRGIAPEELRLSYVRPEHVGIKVAWKDLSRGLAAVVLPDVVNIEGHAFPLIPNQTLYSLDAVSLDEAYAIAALLNSTIVDALLLCIAERAKDSHYRYFGRNVARIPLPRLEPQSESYAKLVRLSRRAHQGDRVQEQVDRVVAAMYGINSSELDVLGALVNRRLGAR